MQLRDYVRGLLGPIRTMTAQIAQRQRIVGHGLVAVRDTPVTVPVDTTVAVDWTAPPIIDDFAIAANSSSFSAPYTGRVRITAILSLYATAATAGNQSVIVGVRHVSGITTTDIPLCVRTVGAVNAPHTYAVDAIRDVVAGDTLWITITTPTDIAIATTAIPAASASFMYVA